MRRSTALFRCDASVGIGGGHAVRCLALAEALDAAGWTVRFAATAETARLVPGLRRYPGSLLDLDGTPGDIDRIQGSADGADLVVIDGYGFDAAYEAGFAGWAGAVLAIDDAPTRPHAADLLLDQTLGREPADYEGLTRAGAVRLCGSRYALLRSPFAAARAAGLAPVGERERLRLLVSFGLTDAGDATGLALAALAGLPVEVDVVLGDHAPHRAGVARQAAGNGWRLIGEVDAAGMAALLAAADVAIGAPGSATYERCCLGRPALLLVLADNQRPNAAALAAAGAGVVLGEIGAIDAATLRARLAPLLADRDLLRAMGARAAALADGEGARRVAVRLGERQGDRPRAVIRTDG